MARTTGRTASWQRARRPLERLLSIPARSTPRTAGNRCCRDEEAKKPPKVTKGLDVDCENDALELWLHMRHPCGILRYEIKLVIYDTNVEEGWEKTLSDEFDCDFPTEDLRRRWTWGPAEKHQLGFELADQTVYVVGQVWGCCGGNFTDVKVTKKC